MFICVTIFMNEQNKYLHGNSQIITNLSLFKTCNTLIFNYHKLKKKTTDLPYILGAAHPKQRHKLRNSD